MAFLYKRTLRLATGKKKIVSPFWYIEHRDPTKIRFSPAGRVIPVREPTPFRIDNALQTARARELEARMTLAERTTRSARDQSEWRFWVVPFIEKIATGRSRERYLDAWRMLEMWLDAHDIRFPSQVSYSLCDGYVPWREQPDQEQRKFQVRRTTANYEFRFFRRLLKEAVKCGFCPANPAREVDLKRRKDQPRILKPDLTDAQLQDIWRAFDDEPDEPFARRTCFRRAFAIALLHGVRLNETNVNPQTDVIFPETNGSNVALAAIKFLQKGSRIRWKPLHPQLIPFFKQLRAEGATQTFPLDRDAHGKLKWNTAWHNFFTHRPRQAAGGNYRPTAGDGGRTAKCFKDREGLEHIGFHSLRVTVENVLREAGIAKEVREMYLTHEHESHDDINAEYDRVKLREMVACHAPLARPWLDLDGK